MSCCNAGAATLPICCYRTADYQETYTYVGFDITGWLFSLKVAPSRGAAATFTVTTTANGNGSVITITNAATGEFEVLIREEDIALIPAATPASDPVSYTYTITITDADGIEGVFTQGAFTVLAGI